MGYNTYFTLKECSDRAQFTDAVEARIDHVPWEDSCKWYDHDEDISAVMVEGDIEHVEIHGEGEEQGDVWDKVYLLQPDLKTVRIETFGYELQRCPEPSVASLKPTVGAPDHYKLAEQAISKGLK